MRWVVRAAARSSLVLCSLFCVHATTSARQPFHAWHVNETGGRESAGKDFRELFAFSSARFCPSSLPDVVVKPRGLHRSRLPLTSVPPRLPPFSSDPCNVLYI
ncbi:unnamed protein product [Ectocarpus sp. 4 AP-2014]